jgi:hypothetical protein
VTRDHEKRADARAFRWRLWAVGSLAVAAALALRLYPLTHPMILYDDFQILVKSRTWGAAWSNVWLTANEHAMPFGRLATAASVQLAGRQSALPQTIALQGPLALLLALPLLFAFVSRELGHPSYGLVAVIVFGVTSLYNQAVSWFASSFSIPCLDQMLLALLCAQQWQRSGRWLWLAGCTVNCGLAPGWFASGILAGPLCVVYLLCAPAPVPGGETAGGARLARWRAFRAVVVKAIPLLGTAAFLAISLPRTAAQILHLPHYEGRTTWDVFHPLTGVVSTGRSLVDNLGLGALGISGVCCPPALVALGLVLWAAALAWWWRPPGRGALPWVGLALIFTSYVLTYSARADWGYEDMTVRNWSRYHLLPQAGLALIVCGGLKGRQGIRFHLQPDGDLSYRQARGLTVLILVLFIIHLPRAIIGSPRYESQVPALLRVENIDARCRTHHISAENARAALPPFVIPGCNLDDNAWDLLQGSDDPLPLSIEEIRVLLNGGF